MLTTTDAAGEPDKDDAQGERFEQLLEILGEIAAGLRQPAPAPQVNVAAPNVTLTTPAPVIPAPLVEVTGPPEWTRMEVDIERDSANWIKRMHLTRKP
jgi:hypothetical protein